MQQRPYASGRLIRSVRPRNLRLTFVSIVLLAAVQLAVTFVTVIPGYLSIDEALYHWMTKSFSETYGLALSNGYEEARSPELVHPFIKVHDGKLFPPHPYLFPMIALPFYLAMGFKGLFLLNSVCFIGVTILTFLTAKKLFNDPTLARNSILMLVFATFAWEYSQAAWPHSVSMLFVLGAFYLFLCAYGEPSGGRSRALALCAGLVAGLGMGIRLDTVLVFPALTLPLLVVRPWRLTETALTVCGAFPGLGALALANFIKFGVFDPFSYGPQGAGPVYNRPIMPSSELFIVAALVLALVIILRQRVLERIPVKQQGKAAAGAAIVLIAALLLVPDVRSAISSVISYGYVSLVDMRALDPGIVFSPMIRTPGGGVVYVGAHKKALLQSMPFLALLVVPVAVMWRKSKDVSAILLLLLVPLTFTTYYSYSFLQGEAGGGLCLNQRYLLPSFPFLCILAAYAVKRVIDQAVPLFVLYVSAAAALLTVAYFLLATRLASPNLQQLEFPLLVFPLLIAAGLALSLAALQFLQEDHLGLLKPVAVAFIASALVWSSLVAFCYDLPRHRLLRAIDYSFGDQAIRVIPEDSILFAGHGFFTASVSLIEKSGVWIAYPAADKFRDFKRLLEFNLRLHRKVFGVFRDREWKRLREGLLHSYTVTSLLRGSDFFLGEITVSDAQGKPPRN